MCVIGERAAKSCGSSQGAFRNQVGWNWVKSAVNQKPYQSAMSRCDDGGLEALRLGDRPVGQQPAAAAAGHAEPCRIDVASLDHLVHAGHQVFVVVAGIVVLDDVAEVLTVRRAAARVGEEHDVALRGHPHELVRVGVAVCRVRAAVNLEDHRILARRIEVRRFQNPALDLPAVEARVPDFFRLALADVGEERVVDVRDLRRRAAGRRQDRDVADVGLGRDRGGQPRAVCGGGVGDDVLRPGGDGFHRAGRDDDPLEIRAAAFSAVTTISDDPSFDQRIGFGLSPRGGAWSPPIPPLTSKSYDAVRLRGALPGVASTTQRSGWL